VSAYETLAEEYAAELDSNPWNSLYERPATIALLPTVAGKQVLDVGCGPGSQSEWLVQNGAHVTGFDVSASTIAGSRAAGTSTSASGVGRSRTCSRQSRRPASGSSGSPSPSPSNDVAIDIPRLGRT
jgi:SAM-dependent methyltransferase